MSRTFRLPDYLWIEGSDLKSSGSGFCDGCELYAEALYWPPNEEGWKTRALCERCTSKALCESCRGTGRLGDGVCPDCAEQEDAEAGSAEQTWPQPEDCGREWLADDPTEAP